MDSDHLVAPVGGELVDVEAYRPFEAVDAMVVASGAPAVVAFEVEPVEPEPVPVEEQVLEPEEPVAAASVAVVPEQACLVELEPDLD